MKQNFQKTYSNSIKSEKSISDCLFLDKENEIFVKRLVSLNNITKQIHSTNDFSSLLAISLELLLSFFDAEKAIFIIKEKSSEELKVELDINLFNEHEKTEYFLNNFVKDILGDKNTSFFINQINNKDFKAIKSALIGFLEINNKLLGYIVVFNYKKNLFDEKDSFFMQELSNQLSVAINNVLLYENLKKENEQRNHLQRYFPANIVSKIVQKKLNLNLSGEYEEGSVIFCKLNIIDLEKINPNDLFKLINSLTTLITQIIFSYNGTVEKISSDSLVAVFGAPLKIDNHAELAVISALEILSKLADIKYSLKITIGISTGSILYGNIGFFQRHDFNISGEQLKTAKKLTTLTTENKVFLSNNTYEKVKTNFKFSSQSYNIDNLPVFEVLEKLSTEEVEKSLNTLRVHSRVSLKTIAYLIKGNLRSTGVVRDISIGGVSIGTVGDYKLNDNLIMTFKLSDSLTLRNIKGIVKHIEKAKFDTFTNKMNTIMGIEFSNLSLKEQDDIINFISESEKITLVKSR